MSSKIIFTFSAFASNEFFTSSKIATKSFVIFRLNAFSKNPRKEINTKEKIYFYDLGVRNAVINDFNEIQLRADKGFVFENYVIAERYKKLSFLDRKA